MDKKQINQTPVEKLDHAAVAFDSADCICTTNNGKVHINARVDFANFNEIIECNLVYIIDYLKSKNFKISVDDKH